MRLKTKTLRVSTMLREGEPLSLPDDDAANKSLDARLASLLWMVFERAARVNSTVGQLSRELEQCYE